MGLKQKGLTSSVRKPAFCDGIQKLLDAKAYTRVVHNAALGVAISTEKTTEQIYDDLMITNVRAPFFLTQAALPHIPKGGRIILISSIAARRFTFGGLLQPVYASSKAAVECLARNWAVEVGGI